MSPAFPSRPFAVAVLVRASVIWLAIRAAMGMVGAPVAPGQTPGWSVVISGAVIALVAGLVRLDLARLNEELFLANLGVRTGTLTTLAALPALALEIARAALIA